MLAIDWLLSLVAERCRKLVLDALRCIVPGNEVAGPWKYCDCAGPPKGVGPPIGVWNCSSSSSSGSSSPAYGFSNPEF